jgi:hypothetical protein
MTAHETHETPARNLLWLVLLLFAAGIALSSAVPLASMLGQ